MNILLVMSAAATLSVPRVDLGPMPAMERVDEMFETGGAGSVGSVGRTGGSGEAGLLPLHRIGCVNWPVEFPDRPEVSFRIAHSGDEIYIKYYVTEQATRAVWGADNGRPWEDSCVEFFVSAGGSDIYYNLEMSCIGFGILHGGAPGARGPVGGPAGGVEKVRRLASLPPEPFGVREGRQSWTLTLAIPAELFAPLIGGTAIEGASDARTMSGRTLRANFYKCGDGLPRPHYLSWSPIDTPRPSFHEPGFFGELFFE